MDYLESLLEGESLTLKDDSRISYNTSPQMEYFNPSPIVLEYGLQHKHGCVIVIPSWQQKTMADRKFFSFNDGVNRIDVDQTIQNNPRVVLEPLAKILGLVRIKQTKKPELAQAIQERIVFA